MSPYIPSLALGLIACAPVVHARPAQVPQADSVAAEDPTSRPTRDPALSPAAPAGQGPAAASDSSQAVILLTNGNIKFHEGTIVEEGDEVVLKHRAGVVRLRRDQIEGVFPSVEELYQYKVDRLPSRDPDEHMKLALWCISHKLNDQAKTQLQAVLTYSPGDRRALGMLKNLDAMTQRHEMRDQEVVRTSMDAVDPTPDPRNTAGPAPSVIDQIRAYRGPVGKPKVFDLPDALAVKRYQEFTNTIHPLLQNACARCHDENSGRNYQLIRARVQKDLANDLLVRTNLDATLGLIDRYNPAHSPLLVNAVVPHGPEQKPILGDPNSPAYRMLWTWVESLKHDSSVAQAAPAPPGVAPAPANGFAPVPTTAEAPQPGSPYGGGFAAGRGTPPVAAPVHLGLATPPPAPLPTHTVDIQRREGVHPSVPADANFQTVSPLMSQGPNTATLQGQNGAAGPVGTIPPPALPGLPPAPANGQPVVAPVPGAAPAPTDPAVNPVSGTAVTLPDGSQWITQPDGTHVLRLKDGTIAPVLDKAAVENAKPEADPGKKPEKTFQINPRLLEQFQKRTARPPGS